jgi:hypothetical protein
MPTFSHTNVGVVTTSSMELTMPLIDCHHNDDDIVVYIYGRTTRQVLVVLQQLENTMFEQIGGFYKQEHVDVHLR